VEWAALITWVLTALGGSTLAVMWLRHGGAGQGEGIRALRLLSHAVLAAVGLALWTGFVLSDEPAFAWSAVGLLVVVAVIGASMFAIWLRGHNRRDHTAVPAETSFPLPVVAFHGVLGLATFVLAVLAAGGVGT
jgi:hypothetical protein